MHDSLCRRQDDSLVRLNEGYPAREGQSEADIARDVHRGLEDVQALHECEQVGFWLSDPACSAAAARSSVRGTARLVEAVAMRRKVGRGIRLLDTCAVHARAIQEQRQVFSCGATVEVCRSGKVKDLQSVW